MHACMPGSAIHINQNVNVNQPAASLALQKSNKQFNDFVTVTDTSSVTFYKNKIMSFKLKKEIIYLSLHCHHQNDSCIKMGSGESHFSRK